MFFFFFFFFFFVCVCVSFVGFFFYWFLKIISILAGNQVTTKIIFRLKGNNSNLTAYNIGLLGLGVLDE